MKHQDEQKIIEMYYHDKLEAYQIFAELKRKIKLSEIRIVIAKSQMTCESYIEIIVPSLMNF
jgi:hypothetical protein